MSANTVNTNLNRALLIGGDKVAAYSQFFVLPNKTAAVSAFNLPDCYEVRFQIGFFDDKITEKYCKCFLPPEVAGKYVGSVYLKCPSCNEEDAYVRVTNTNPFIVLDTPQALGNTIRAVLVHSVTGEVFDVSDPVAQEELAKARVFIHFDVDYEAKTEAERGCVEFCPPLGDWNIDCETLGWTEIPNCYPADWFEEIKDCGKVSSIDIAANGVITLDKADKVRLGYLLKEPKWWACNAVYDCYGNLIGYGMQNQCNDCPPCVPDKVAASIEQPPTPPTPPEPQHNTCDYKGELWNNDKLGDDAVFQIYAPEGDTNLTYSPLKVSSADEMIEVLNITQKYMYFFMDKLQNDQNAPVYEFATYKEIQEYMDSLGNPYYIELKDWCDAHNIRDNFSTDEEYEKAILDFIADTRGILLRPKWRDLVKLRQGEVLPKVEVVKASPNQEVTATVNNKLCTNTIEQMLYLYPNYVKLKFCAIGAQSEYDDFLIFCDVNGHHESGYYFHDRTDSICVLRFVVVDVPFPEGQ